MNQGIQGDVLAIMPELLSSGLFTSLCTIKVPSGVFSDAGAPDGQYVDLSGHVNIPCIAPPLSIGSKVQPAEVKKMEEILSSNFLHVLLGGYFPAIRSTYQAIVDGTAYEVMGFESDSQNQMTRLAVRELTV